MKKIIIIVKELIEDKVERRLEAFYPPKSPNIVISIFNFLSDIQQYVITIGGMESVIIGLDLYKIGEIGKQYYNIDVSRYMYWFKYFERKMLEKQNLERKMLN